MRIILIFICLFTFFSELFSQSVHTIHGVLSDSVTHERLVGASVLINGEGVISDVNGEFSRTTREKNCRITVSYMGYKTFSSTFQIKSDTTLNIRLTPVSVNLNEAVVEHVRNDMQNRTVPGMIQLTGKDLKMLPAFMGEHDLLRTLQYLPGVKTVTEGDMGIYIRGGGPDQNLILLDDAVIYNPTHVLGFFSVFNDDVIENVNFYKAGIPANYGNRISSVIDIHTTENIPDGFNVKGSLGLISSKIYGNIPFADHSGAIYVAARKSYIDKTIQPVFRIIDKNTSSAFNSSDYSFYDVNVKAVFKKGSSDKFSLSFYQGRDDFDLNKLSVDYKNDLSWGNRAASVKWTHHFVNDLVLENGFWYSDYNFRFAASQESVQVGFLSGVDDFGYKLLLIKNNPDGNRLKTGIDYQHHVFRPNNLSAEVNDYDLKFSPNKKLFSHEGALFLTREFTLSPRLNADAGIRLTGFAYTGPYDEYIKNASGEIADTLRYHKGEWMGSYYAPETHISVRYLLTDVSSVKMSFQNSSQYIHLLSSSAVTMPLDAWMPSSKYLKPQKGIQFTLGYFRDLKNKTMTAYADLYYKKLNNQVELIHGIVNSYAENLLEESMTFGRGRSYGVEVYFQKKTGRFTGWLGYTLSRSEKEFDQIQQGKIYPAKYDRRHDVKLVSSFILNKKWTLDGSFIFSSGNAMTLPEQLCLIEGNLINLYGETNSFRLPPYHRLDLSLIFFARKNENYESSWIFSVFNVYNRPNIFYIYFKRTVDPDRKIYSAETRQVSIFPVMPSVTWTIKFN